jgi:hypothetical protein
MVGMGRPRVPEEEIVPLGEEIYERGVRPKLGPEHEGKFVVLDVTTGEYAIADDDLEASDLVLERNPEAILYGLRVGPGAVSLPAHRIGGGGTAPFS